MVAAARRFCDGPWFVALEQDEQTTLGAGMLDRYPQQRLDELAELYLDRHRLRGLEHRSDIELLRGRANGSGGGCRGWRVTVMRVKLFELPHLAERAPAQIAAPRLPQTGMGDRLDAARRVEARAHLMGHALVLHEAVLASRLNGALVQTHGVGVPPLEPGDLRRYQGAFVAKGGWIVLSPHAQLLPMGRKEVAPPSLLVGRSVLVERRHCQRRIV